MLPKNDCGSIIFLKSTSKEETGNISSLNSNKASGPNSIPYKILFLPKNEISMQMTDLFNLSFCDCHFSIGTQNCKGIPVLRKAEN